MRQQYLAVLLLSVGFVGLVLTAFSSAPRPPKALPNIVLVVTDDQGWNAVGYHNNEILTPHLDALAAEGVELDRFYVTPRCSPTRAGLMTGRYPIRYGLQASIIKGHELHGIPAEEELLPEMLARAGYARRGMVGKWHLGHQVEAYHPLRNGFTDFYGAYTAQIDYFTHLNSAEKDWHRGDVPDGTEGYATDLIADEAVRFIDANAGQPFFLYVPFNAPHRPWQAPQRCLDYYPGPVDDSKTYRAMITCADEALGRIVEALEANNLVDDTVILFLSDNGGSTQIQGNNDPLRGGKGSLKDGGIRVPAVIHWPGGGLADGTRLDAMMTYLDVFPTLRRIAGLTPPAADSLDGVDMLEVLQGTTTPPERDFFSFSIEAPGREDMAVFSGPWKLRWHGTDVRNDPLSGVVRLYRIVDDPLEGNDLENQHPQVVADLLARLQQFRTLRPARFADPFSDPPPGWVPPVNWVMHPQPLGIPDLHTPAPDAQVSGFDAAMTWAAVEGAATYHLHIATDPAFDNLVRNEPALTDNTLVNDDLAPAATYYWRVRSINARGDLYSFWSDTRRLTTHALSALPGPARLRAPGNGAVAVRVAPAFSWQAATAADAYHLQVATTADFSQIVFEADTVTTTTYQGSLLAGTTEYVWRVRGRNTAGAGPWTPPRRFTTGVLPGPVALTAPQEDAVDQPSTVRFAWQPAAAAQAYHLQVSTDSSFAPLAFEADALTQTVHDVGPLPYLTRHYWRVRGINDIGGGPWSATRRFTVAVGTATEEPGEALPGTYALYANYPNPFNRATTLRFDLPEAAWVSLAVYDLLGREVATLVEGLHLPGRHVVQWEGRDRAGRAVPSGTYLYRFQAGGFTQTRPMLVLK